MRRETALLLLLLVVGDARSAAAQHATPVDLARARWNEGARAFASGNLEGARMSFLAAYDAFPNMDVALNLGEAEYRTHHFADAVRHLTIALENPELTSEEQRAAKRSLDQAMTKVGTLVFNVDVEGADLLVDGELIGRSPLGEAWFLDQGEYIVGAQKSDYTDATQKVVMKPGAVTRVSLMLRASASSPDVGSPQATTGIPLEKGTWVPASLVDGPRQPKSTGDRGQTIVVATGATLTAIATGVGGYFLVRRSSELEQAHMLRDRLGDPGPAYACAMPSAGGPPTAGVAPCEQVANSYRSVDRDRNLATAAFVAAGALSIATVATFLLWPKSKAASPALHVAPLERGTGVVVGGGF